MDGNDPDIQAFESTGNLRATIRARELGKTAASVSNLFAQMRQTLNRSAYREKTTLNDHATAAHHLIMAWPV